MKKLTKSENQSLIPRTHMVGENGLLKVIFWPPHAYPYVLTYHIHIQILKNNKKGEIFSVNLRLAYLDWLVNRHRDSPASISAGMEYSGPSSHPAFYMGIEIKLKSSCLWRKSFLLPHNFFSYVYVICFAYMWLCIYV